MKLSTELMPKMLERAVKKGEGYQKARQAFNKLFQEYWRTAQFAAKFPGGLFVHRDHDGDPHARPPFTSRHGKRAARGHEAGRRARLQGARLRSQAAQLSAGDALDATGASSSRIASIIPSTNTSPRCRRRSCMSLLNPMTMERLHDNELKIVSEADRYTLAEHLRTLVEAIFSEWKDGEGRQVHRYVPVHSGLPAEPAAHGPQGAGISRAGAL